MGYVDIYNTGNRYKTVYVDPPWMERGGGKIRRGADRHYGLMRTEEIRGIPVSRLACLEGCHLYLWATNNFMREAFECVERWGFEYVTTITWFKDKIGLGQYYRGVTEHCLFCVTKNRLPYKHDDSGKRCQGVTGFQEARTVHSKKPQKMREMIEKVSYGPRIELFARDAYDGWDCWGIEAPR